VLEDLRLTLQNLDRKPPTLTRTLPLSRVALPTSPALSNDSQLLQARDDSALIAVVASNSSLAGYRISLPDLLASSPAGLVPIIHPVQESISVQIDNPIRHFVRTPNGRGLLALAENKEMGAWFKQQRGKTPKSQAMPKALLGKAHWRAAISPVECAIFAKGRAIVSYTHDHDGAGLYLQHLDPEDTCPSEPIPFPDFGIREEDSLEMLLAVSDIDDGYSHRGRRTRRAVVMAASASGDAWVWRLDSVTDTSTSSIAFNIRPNIYLLSRYRLPVGSSDGPLKPPHLIMPVDPMGWHQPVVDWHTDTPLQDMILTVTEDGVLEFWIPKLGQHLAGPEVNGRFDSSGYGTTGKPFGSAECAWSRTGVVRTGKQKATMARCSSRKKTVISKRSSTWSDSC
jgi:hypothetical protein